MTRSVTVVSLVLSLLLSVSAVPARAESAEAEALGRFLGAAASLFILGSILKSAPDSLPDPTPQVAPAPRAKAPPVVKLAPRATKRDTLNPIPAQCLRRVDSARTRFVVGRPCLNRNDYRSARKLPEACRVDMKARGRLVPAYSMRCLRQRGYTTTDRR